MPNRPTIVKVLLCTLLIAPPILRAQASGWSFEAAAGQATLAMDDIIKVNKRNILTYRENNIPLPYFDSLRPATFIMGKIAYEFVYGLSISASYLEHNAEVRTDYSDARSVISMVRSVGTRDLMLGLEADLFKLFNRFQISAELILGRSEVTAAAQADADINTPIEGKPIDLNIAEMAEYHGSETFMSAGFSLTLPLAGPLMLKATARYKEGPSGFLSGTLISDGVTADITSVTEFDFSGIYLSAGLAFEF